MATLTAGVLLGVLLAVAAVRLLPFPHGNATGTLFVRVAGKTSSQLGAGGVDVLTALGWSSLGSHPAVAVPAAPGDSLLISAPVAAGHYASVRINQQVLVGDITVASGQLEPLLVAVLDGAPTELYAGDREYDLGLNELAGHVQALPEFALVDQDGRPLNRASFAGRPALIAASHASCGATCPLYTALFLDLGRRLGGSVQLAEISDDPVHDTPAVLRDYATSVGAKFTLGTGTPDAVAAFWGSFGVPLRTGDSHSSVVLVVDSHGYVRSHWQGVPDLAGIGVPDTLASRLDAEGRRELGSHGSGWGEPQLLDSLAAAASVSAHQGLAGGAAPSFPALSAVAGHPAVINFWASWCTGCRKEMPGLATQVTGATALLLVDERDSEPAADAFLKELRIDLATDHRVRDPAGSVGALYGVTALPTTIFVRSDHTIEGIYLGEMPDGVLARHLAAISGG